VGPAVTDQSALLRAELWWVPVSWVFYDLALVLELSFSDVVNYSLLF
jgi:hypothetical protein